MATRIIQSWVHGDFSVHILEGSDGFGYKIVGPTFEFTASRLSAAEEAMDKAKVFLNHVTAL